MFRKYYLATASFYLSFFNIKTLFLPYLHWDSASIFTYKILSVILLYSSIRQSAGVRIHIYQICVLGKQIFSTSTGFLPRHIYFFLKYRLQNLQELKQSVFTKQFKVIYPRIVNIIFLTENFAQPIFRNLLPISN